MSELDWGALQQEAKTAGAYPDGDYNVIIIESSATTASTGKPMIKIKARITDGPRKDKTIVNQFVVSPDSPVALKIFFQHMDALGLTANFFATNPSMDVVAKNLLNRGAVFTLGTRQWQGADRNEVKAVKPLSAGGPLVPGMVVGPPQAGPSGASPVATSPVPTSTPNPTTTPVSPAPVASSGTTPTIPGAPPSTPF